MKNSRKFDDILNDCLERLLVKGETIKQCLNSFPEFADDLKPLLQTTLIIKKASAIQPRPEFRDRARYQLYSALRETEHKKRRSFFSWQPQWATAVISIVLVLLITGSTVAAASTSMPDQPLYPVKIATERVQVFLTPSAIGKAELYAKLADKRVLEIARMADENKPEQIEKAAQQLDTHLAKIADLVSTQETSAGVLMAPSLDQAPTVSEEPPSPEQAVADNRVSSSPGQAGKVKDETKKVDHRADLRATITNDAASNTEHLRALLETAPESAKPALQQAIAISESGYERALNSLN